VSPGPAAGASLTRPYGRRQGRRNYGRRQGRRNPFGHLRVLSGDLGRPGGRIGRYGPVTASAGAEPVAQRAWTSASSSSRSRSKQLLSSRETCIWEMPSCSAIRLCVMPPKNRR
jgi:hypothetical protein